MDTYSGTVDNPVETRATTIHSLWISTIGDTMGLSPQSDGPRLVTEGLTTTTERSRNG